MAKKFLPRIIPQWPSDWYEGGKAGLKCFYFVAGLTFVWCLISYFQLLPQNFISSVTLVVSVLLFVISIPTGIFLQRRILNDS